MVSNSLPSSLSARLNVIIETLPRYWANRRYPHFTYQGIFHSERVNGLIDQLTNELREIHRLNAYEAFILSAAAYLYEIGMQSPNLQPILDISAQNIKLTPAHLLQIREVKHLLSEQLILDSVRSNYNGPKIPLGLVVPPDELTILIAGVCRWCSDESLNDVPEIELVNGRPIRMRLLVALLRLSDNLYIDRDRFDLGLLEWSGLPEFEYIRWWVYQYTKIYLENGLIRFFYELPSHQLEYLDYVRAIVEHQFSFENNSSLRYLWDSISLRVVASNKPTVRNVDKGLGLIRPFGSSQIDLLLRNKRPFLKLINIVEPGNQTGSDAIKQNSKKLASPNDVTVMGGISHVESLTNNICICLLYLKTSGTTPFQLGNDFDIAVMLIDNESQAHLPKNKENISEVRINFDSTETSLELEINAHGLELVGSMKRSIAFYKNTNAIYYIKLIPKTTGKKSILVNVLQDGHWVGSNRMIFDVRTTPKELGMSEYVDFELYIDPNGHVRAKSQVGTRTTDIPISIPTSIINMVTLIENNSPTSESLHHFGKELYDFLFRDLVNVHFIQTEAVAQQNSQKVRVRLAIENDVLAKLPWEFLFRQEVGHYLAINPNTVLSRYLDLPLPTGSLHRRERPINLLMIISNPSDQIPLDPDEWEELILTQLAELINKNQIKIQSVREATYDQIKDALLKCQPDIIQFVGHGIYEDKKGYLAMVGPTGQTWKVDDESFADLFLGYTENLGLISLATCESAKSDSPQGFIGIAPKLVQRGVPAVIAMQYKVLISTAQIFLKNLYKDLAAGKPIDWAVQDARNAVAFYTQKENREFATPVLFMRAKDGRIFDFSEEQLETV